MRFLQSPSVGGYAFTMKMLNYFLQHIVGYTWISESVSSFNTHEKTNTDGALSSSNFNFVSSSSPFVLSDQDKWLVIVDNSNPENSGIYRVTNYVNSSTVTIDFRTDPTEYPTTSTGLTWYLMDEDYDTPTTNDGYFRLRTSHVDAWEIEFKLMNSSPNYGIATRVSLDGDWTSNGKILDTTRFGINTSGTLINANLQYRYFIAETDGSIIHLWEDATTKDHNSLVSMVPLAPFESGHSSYEEWILLGPVGLSDDTTATITRGYSNDVWGHGYIWRDNPDVVRNAYPMEYSVNLYTDGFVTWSSREINARTSKNDMLPGGLYITDEDNDYDEYEFIGNVGGFYLVRSNLPERQTIDDSGTKDKLHIISGVTIDWPGFTPQY
jgi:hypothetical protein